MTTRTVQRPRIGGHISAAGGAHHAPENARLGGNEVFQFFSRPPQGGKAPELTDEIVSEFQAKVKKYKMTAYVHAPYFVNFASSTPRIRHGTIFLLREELQRGSTLGVKALMTHIGSAKDFGRPKAIYKVIEGVKEVMKGYTGSTQFCLEVSAGAGQQIGGTFEELGCILKKVPTQVGICLDTCHVFASGYDLRDAQAVKVTLADFDKHIGFDKLVVVHVNDSKGDLGDNRDRHEHIGKGKIGTQGLKTFMKHPIIKKLDVILETPFDGRPADVKALKKLRDS